MNEEIIDSRFIFLFALCDNNLDGFHILKGPFFNGSILLKFFMFLWKWCFKQNTQSTLYNLWLFVNVRVYHSDTYNKPKNRLV